MKTHTTAAIDQAAADGDGICLACGELQPFPTWQFFGICCACDEPEVVAADNILKVLRVVDLDPTD